jgi:hypothetical protein
MAPIPTRPETFRDRVFYWRGAIMGFAFPTVLYFLVRQFTE